MPDGAWSDSETTAYNWQSMVRQNIVNKANELTASDADAVFCGKLVVLAIEAVLAQVRIQIAVEVRDGRPIVVAVVFQIEAIWIWSSGIHRKEEEKKRFKWKIEEEFCSIQYFLEFYKDFSSPDSKHSKSSQLILQFFHIHR